MAGIIKYNVVSDEDPAEMNSYSKTGSSALAPHCVKAIIHSSLYSLPYRRWRREEKSWKIVSLNMEQVGIELETGGLVVSDAR